MQRKSFLLAAVSAAALSLGSASAQAQAAWPAKPVKVVVPFPAGGATDVVTRALAQRLSAELGQPFVIENKPGAATAIASEYVSRATPDGYTIMMGASSALVNNRFMYKRLSYDPDGFELISLAAVMPLVLVANTALPANDVQGLVQHAKSNPGKVNYASYGTGTISHLATALLGQRAGAPMEHVPYKGSSEALPALVGGHVSLYADTVITSLPLIKAGKLKPLGVTTARRSALMPDVPTVAEQGFPGYEMVPWVGLIAPKGIPKEAVERLRTAMATVMKNPEFVAEMAKSGAEPPAQLGPAAFAEVVKADIPLTGKLIKDVGIQPQ